MTVSNDRLQASEPVQPSHRQTSPSPNSLGEGKQTLNKWLYMSKAHVKVDEWHFELPNVT